MPFAFLRVCEQEFPQTRLRQANLDVVGTKTLFANLNSILVVLLGLVGPIGYRLGQQIGQCYFQSHACSRRVTSHCDISGPWLNGLLESVAQNTFSGFVVTESVMTSRELQLLE